MKPFYNTQTLQRICDSFSIGKIEKVDFIESTKGNIWRQSVQTNRGKFELLSCPMHLEEAVREKIIIAKMSDWGVLLPKYSHQFDRYHYVIHYSTFIPISEKQLGTDLAVLKKQRIVKIFRVYGSILQFEFANGISASSFASWSLQKIDEYNEYRVLAHSHHSSKERMDEELEKFEKEAVQFNKYKAGPRWIELYFSKKYVLYFSSWDTFNALEFLFPKRNLVISIAENGKIILEKELSKHAAYLFD